MFTRLATALGTLRHAPFDHVVVDEAQDVNIGRLRLLAALGSTEGKMRADGLFFAGDFGQRIFQQAFSWKTLGVDVHGRSRTLLINYRTSHQIRRQADKLLGPEIADVDSNTESRRGTVSVFNGPMPEIHAFKNREEEIAAVGEWLRCRRNEGVAVHEVALFVRPDAELKRARLAVEKAGVPFRMPDEHVDTAQG